MRMLFAMIISLVLMSCGGIEGQEPTVSNLKITTSPVVRGRQAQGEITVADPDGLRGVELQLRFAGPAAITSVVPIQGTSEEIKALAPFVFMLAPAAPTGKYQLFVSAIDSTGNQSDELSAEFVAE